MMLLDQRYTQYFVEQHLSKGVVKSLYENFFSNMATIISNTDADYCFASVFDMMGEEDEQKIVLNSDDKFLDEGLINLGNSIKKNGMYWPFVCKHVNDMRVVEGNHRFIALRQVQYQKPVGVFIQGETILRGGPTKDIVEIIFLFPEHAINDLLVNVHGIYDLQLIAKDTYKIAVKNSKTAYSLHIMLGVYLSRIFFATQISTNPITTNEAAFIEWRAKNIR